MAVKIIEDNSDVDSTLVVSIDGGDYITVDCNFGPSGEAYFIEDDLVYFEDDFEKEGQSIGEVRYG